MFRIFGCLKRYSILALRGRRKLEKSERNNNYRRQNRPEQSRRQLFSVVHLTVMANVMHSRSTKFFQCCSHDENKPGTAPSDGLVSGKERVRRKRGGSKINLRELVAANHATHCNNARRQGFQVSPPEVHSDCLTDGSSGTCSG